MDVDIFHVKTETMSRGIDLLWSLQGFAVLKNTNNNKIYLMGGKVGGGDNNDDLYPTQWMVSNEILEILPSMVCLLPSPPPLPSLALL